ncbi:degT/DnrJ/EryC1/StrS aminotransferase [Streptomyces sp. NPDC085479]|uniref:degT/DnrJ/EryC1/StrS aminotransferase n=1 Tax=Streptomyces sp. NPDC085479 TaxID=3365726 RepID=UPI0037CDD6BB
MELFDTATVLTRVLTSGVVMSIEKSDRELPGLERLLTKRTGRARAALFNSRTGALHGALAGQGLGHGDTVSVPHTDRESLAFLAWLGLTTETTETGGTTEPGGTPAYDYVELTQENADRLPELAAHATAPVLVVDLTGLGFGPAAAVLTDSADVWARAERLKIFGAYDLRTMWTQEEADADLVPGVQFNYRLSPLVAACARMALTHAVRPAATSGAHS